MSELNQAKLVLIWGNVAHFFSIVVFILRLNLVISSEVLFIQLFIPLQLLDYLTNIFFLSVILTHLKKYRKELFVFIFFFLGLSLVARLAVAAILINLFKGNHTVYFPSFAIGVLNFFITNTNLIGLSPLLYSIILFYVSRSDLTDKSSKGFMYFGVINGTLSLLFIIPDFTGGLIFLISGALFLLKSLLNPLFMILLLHDWYREEKILEQNNTFQLAKAKEYPDLETYYKFKDELTKGKYPNYKIFSEVKEIVESFSYPDYEEFKEHHEKVISGGFNDFQTYLDSVKYGIYNFSDYQMHYEDLIRGQFPNLSSYKKAKAQGFETYKSFKEAKDRGIPSKLAFDVFFLIKELSGLTMSRIKFSAILERLSVEQNELITILSGLLRDNLIEGRIEMGSSNFGDNALIVTNFPKDQKIEILDFSKILKVFADMPVKEPVSIDAIADILSIRSNILEKWMLSPEFKNISNKIRYNNIHRTIEKLVNFNEIPSPVISVLLNLVDPSSLIDEKDNTIVDDHLWKKQETLQKRLFYHETINELMEIYLENPSKAFENSLSSLFEMVDVQALAVYRNEGDRYRIVFERAPTSEYISSHFEIIKLQLSENGIIDEDGIFISTRKMPLLSEFQLAELIHKKSGINTFILERKKDMLVEYDLLNEDLEDEELEFLKKVTLILTAYLKQFTD